MWTLTYRIRCSVAWDDRALRTLRQHQQKWTGRLSALSSGYNLSNMPASAESTGFTQLSPETAYRDYTTVLQALRELQSLFPGTQVLVSDEYYVTEPTPVGEVDLDAIEARLREEAEETVEEPAASELDLIDELEGPGEDSEDPQHRKLLEETANKLEQAKRDFEIWKRAQAQREKKSSS